MTEPRWDVFIRGLCAGEPLACTQEQWHSGLRAAVQDYAGSMIEMHQDVYAVIALEEVRRTDVKYGMAALAAGGGSR